MTITDWKRRLHWLGYPYTLRPERRDPDGLVAVFGPASSPKVGRIKTISKTGFLLETDERWPIDEVISLSVQRESSPEAPSPLHIDLQARVASAREEGVGLAFILPPGLDEEVWAFLLVNADTKHLTEPVLLLFRFVQAMVFLCRLCPSGLKEVSRLMGKELDQSRTNSAATIAIMTKELLDKSPRASEVHPHPKILAGILKDGSWARDELLQRLWAGLLASSCTAEGMDLSSREFIDLLIQITTAQAHIFLAACRRAREMAQTSETGLSRVIVTPEEMVQISGTYDLYRSATDVSYLFNFGLIEKGFDFTTYTPKNSFDITPSRLGLKLFERCRGYLLTERVPAL